jgi:hypothetical protein
MNNDPQQYTQPSQQPQQNPYGPPLYTQPPVVMPQQPIPQPPVSPVYTERKFPLWGYIILTVVVLASFGLLASTFIFM